MFQLNKGLFGQHTMYKFFFVGSFNNIIFSPGVDNEACGYRQGRRGGQAAGLTPDWS